MTPNNVLPTGDGPQYPWTQRNVGRSIAVFALGLCIIATGAWLEVPWVGGTGIVVALLGLIGLLHVQLEWSQNVRDSFCPPRPPKGRASTQRDLEESHGARRPNDR